MNIKMRIEINRAKDDANCIIISVRGHDNGTVDSRLVLTDELLDKLREKIDQFKALNL